MVTGPFIANYYHLCHTHNEWITVSIYPTHEFANTHMKSTHRKMAILYSSYILDHSEKHSEIQCVSVFFTKA